MPEEHALAIGKAKKRAYDRDGWSGIITDLTEENARVVGGLSFETCEICGKPGRLVQSSDYWHTACPEHEDPRSFRGD